MGKAHDLVYDYIKSKLPDQPVGISHNCTIFAAENFWLVSCNACWLVVHGIHSSHLKRSTSSEWVTTRELRATPPITFINTPHKMKALNKRHDDIWEYHPEGLRTCLDRYWNKYKKPIIITENGVCDGRFSEVTGNTGLRADCSSGDSGWHQHQRLLFLEYNGTIFEWHLGPSMRFGVYTNVIL